MIIVTGAAGFIGSRLVHELNARGETEILIVDDVVGDTYKNLRTARIADYMNIPDFYVAITSNKTFPEITAIYHQGACSDTMVSDSHFMLERNFTYSKALLHYAVSHRIPFVYASSASVYGTNPNSVSGAESPINLYAWSKWMFDQYVQRMLPSIQTTVVGLRYFNVYGAGERHKGRMQSMVSQMYRRLVSGDTIRLFGAYEGYGAGEHERDFVHESDCVKVNLYMGSGRLREGSGAVRQGIVNVGTGKAISFNAVVNELARATQKTPHVEYVDFPDALRGKYQSYTQADLTGLRQLGYADPFLSIEEGIAHSMAEWDEETSV